MRDIMREILRNRKNGKACGIPSYCTANPQVLKAILVHAKESGNIVLIEATANQVNQFGGYTGMKPADYSEYIYNLAQEVGCPKERILLGGDHLGPLTWSDKTEKEAMENAKELVRLFTLAGYTKIHLDTSMRLADDDENMPLTDETIARRGVELYKVSMKAYEELLKTNPDALRPSYIIGSEVPIPGGSQEAEDTVAVTLPEALVHTLETYASEFRRQGVEEGIKDVIAVVVQPGVEFGNDEIHVYDREEAAALCRKCAEYPEIMLEGHSTDYQPKSALKEMVEDGVGILKVGPQITFALREALFALSQIEREMTDEDGFICGKKPVNFPYIMEAVMMEEPKDWIKHYHGSELQKRIDRKFSLSDRCRYYFSTDKIQNAIKELYDNVDSVKIPLGLLHQYMPVQYDKVVSGALSMKCEDLVIDHIREVFKQYEYAVE
ncbi:MAG: class II D-tagatose-bisphosphate aldolase, non-catalytic subunit [Firmicutes bacterium]|nr:class II D-tagatose-bisphosphate aldolase, non-catalytic subunit [Bacillota bacterium]